MVVVGLGAAVWLLASGQAGSVDGLFLMLTALLVAASFACYLAFLIRRAMESLQKPAPQAAKATASASKPVPAATSSQPVA